MAKVLKVGAPAFGADGRQKFFGKETLAVGDEIFFVIDGMPATVQVFIQGGGAATYMISTSNDTVADCIALIAEYLDAASSDISVDDDVEVISNVTAVSVINRGTSTDTIIVTWRF